MQGLKDAEAAREAAEARRPDPGVLAALCAKADEAAAEALRLAFDASQSSRAAEMAAAAASASASALKLRTDEETLRASDKVENDEAIAAELSRAAVTAAAAAAAAAEDAQAAKAAATASVMEASAADGLLSDSTTLLAKLEAVLAEAEESAISAARLESEASALVAAAEAEERAAAAARARAAAEEKAAAEAAARERAEAEIAAAAERNRAEAAAAAAAAAADKARHEAAAAQAKKMAKALDDVWRPLLDDAAAAAALTLSDPAEMAGWAESCKAVAAQYAVCAKAVASSKTSASESAVWRFDPSPPLPGLPVTLLYCPDGGPLANKRAVIAHVGFNGFAKQAEVVVELKPSPTPAGARAGAWLSATVQIPLDALTVDAAFTDGNNVWDNNGKKDFHAALAGAAESLEARSSAPLLTRLWLTITEPSRRSPLASAGPKGCFVAEAVQFLASGDCNST